MFESISKKFLDIKQRFFPHGRITEKNIQDAIGEIRKALLDADVNIKVVRIFIERVKEKALGQEVIKQLKAGDLFIKIVYDELVALMGEADSSLKIAQERPTIIMMAGLQGSGKTTTCGKLAKYLMEKEGLKPLLVAADTQRPAAIEQLQKLGEQLGVPVFSQPKLAPPKICAKAIPFAEKNGRDIVILDTAGRLHIDAALMDELADIKKRTKPDNIFLVTDAMTGQDAINSSKEFNAQLEIDGVILTKLDGDARGGAALSIREVTGKPIKFIGVGEKLDRLEIFDPVGMASRILGEGDIGALIEKVSQVIDEDEAAKKAEELLKGKFTFEDFLEQFQMLKKMGNFESLLEMLPGGLGTQLQSMDVDHEKAFARTEAMILSMTPSERTDPDLIDGSRRARIAKGSGTSVQEVNQLLRQFRQMRNMFGKMGKTGGGGLMNMLSGLGGGSMGGLGGLPGFGGGGGTKKKKKKDRKKKNKRRK